MSFQTLILTQGHVPHRIVPARRALTLMYKGKVKVIRAYDAVVDTIDFGRIGAGLEGLLNSLPDEASVGSSLVVKMPAVVTLTRTVDEYKAGVKFSKVNVFMRDGFRCQYCGSSKRVRELTYDHVIPRSKWTKDSRPTTWTNVVACCSPCNLRKGDRTPEQAGMKLLKQPSRPEKLPIVHLHIDMDKVPDLWSDFCPTPSIQLLETVK